MKYISPQELHILCILISNLPPKEYLSLSSTCRELHEFSQLYYENKKRESLIRVKTKDELYYILPNGVKEGECKNYYEDGTLRSICNYINDKIDGSATMYYPCNTNLIMMKCTYKDDEKHGECIIYHENQQIYNKSYFKQGKNEGISTVYDTNGILITRIEYKNGLRDGISEIYMSNVLKSRTNYINDKREGLEYSYTSRGALESIKTYKDDVLEGIVENYYPNSSILYEKYTNRDGKLIPSSYTAYEINGDIDKMRTKLVRFIHTEW